jgi:hypothetical protein
MLLVKGAKPHLRPSSIEVVNPDSYCPWKEGTPLECSKNGKLKELLERVCRGGNRGSGRERRRKKE